MENKINIKLLSMAGQGGAAFGIGLTELAKGRQDIMVLSSDMSTPAGLDLSRHVFEYGHRRAEYDRRCGRSLR